MEPSESLQRTISDDQRAALALAISRSDGNLPAKLDQVADQLGVSIADLAELLNDPGFIKLVRAITKAQASLSFHTNIKRVSDIAATAKPKLTLAAMQMLGKISGDLVNHKTVDVRMTFEDLRKREGESDPLGNLFDIRSDVIEAEIKQEVTDDYEEWEAQQ